LLPSVRFAAAIVRDAGCLGARQGFVSELILGVL
jgi:hypothetical protein